MSTLETNNTVVMFAIFKQSDRGFYFRFLGIIMKGVVWSLNKYRVVGEWVPATEYCNDSIKPPGCLFVRSDFCCWGLFRGGLIRGRAY